MKNVSYTPAMNWINRFQISKGTMAVEYLSEFGWKVSLMKNSTEGNWLIDEWRKQKILISLLWLSFLPSCSVQSARRCCTDHPSAVSLTADVCTWARGEEQKISALAGDTKTQKSSAVVHSAVTDMALWHTIVKNKWVLVDSFQWWMKNFHNLPLRDERGEYCEISF